VCVHRHRRRIPSETISQSESGADFKHSLEYPDLPQPPKCLPVTADDRHQGNITESDQKVYIERIEDPRGLATRQRSVVKVAAEWV
jgi:hypothetical protein